MRADLLNRLLDGCKFCATCTFVCMKVCVMHALGSGEPSRGICSSLVLAAKANEASFTGQHTPKCDCDFYRSNLRRKKNSTNFSKPLWYCEQEPISWSRVIKWKAIWMSGWDFTMSQPRCGNQPWLLFVLLQSLLELRGGGGHELLRFIIRVNLFFLKKKKKGRSRKPQGVMHHYQLSQFRQIPLPH